MLQLREVDRAPSPSRTQLRKAAIARDLKQPPFGRHIRSQCCQGDIKLEEDELQHIIGLLIVIEKPPNVAKQRAVVSIYQGFKGELVACTGLSYQDMIRNSCYPRSAALLYVSHLLLLFTASIIPCRCAAACSMSSHLYCPARLSATLSSTYQVYVVSVVLSSIYII